MQPQIHYVISMLLFSARFLISICTMAPVRLFSTETPWFNQHGLASKLIVEGVGNLPDENSIGTVKGGGGCILIMFLRPIFGFCSWFVLYLILLMVY